MAEKILEKLKDNHGLSEDLQQRISSMVQQFGSLDDEGKAEFTQHMNGLFKDSLNKLTEGSALNKLWEFSQSYTLLFLAIFVFLFIFVFFGYKLYKSLVERERKREEKRRNKQLKKKK